MKSASDTMPAPTKKRKAVTPNGLPQVLPAPDWPKPREYSAGKIKTSTTRTVSRLVASASRANPSSIPRAAPAAGLRAVSCTADTTKLVVTTWFLRAPRCGSRKIIEARTSLSEHTNQGRAPARETEHQRSSVPRLVRLLQHQQLPRMNDTSNVAVHDPQGSTVIAPAGRVGMWNPVTATDAIQGIPKLHPPELDSVQPLVPLQLLGHLQRRSESEDPTRRARVASSGSATRLHLRSIPALPTAWMLADVSIGLPQSTRPNADRLMRSSMQHSLESEPLLLLSPRHSMAAKSSMLLMLKSSLSGTV